MSFNMKAIQQMQAKMLKMQQDLQNSSFEGTAGGGAVTVTMNGKFEITAVKLDKEVVDPDDVAGLEDLIVSACRNATEKVNDEQAKMMTAITGGLKLPPGMGF